MSPWLNLMRERKMAKRATYPNEGQPWRYTTQDGRTITITNLGRGLIVKEDGENIWLWIR